MSEYSDLIFGSYSHEEIAEAVSSSSWQALRILIKGTSTESKLASLRSYVRLAPNSRHVQIQVTNYINALKRGGQLK